MNKLSMETVMKILKEIEERIQVRIGENHENNWINKTRVVWTFK